MNDSATDTRIIDGKAFAAGLRANVAARVEALKTRHGIEPGLAVVLVGENPASEVYVRNKAKQTRAAGMRSFEHRLPATTSQEDLLALVRRLNDDPLVSGILVQLPLPGADRRRRGHRDHRPGEGRRRLPHHQRRSARGGRRRHGPVHPARVSDAAQGPPRRPLGRCGRSCSGRSNIVGKPMAHLLIRESCTVTVAHSRTRDLAGECRRADILVAAVGRPRMVPGDWIRPGAVVIDVGINRIEAENGRTRLVGDVDFESALAVASGITPVPGGVGPMTIACLLHNTVLAACRRHGVGVPDP